MEFYPGFDIESREKDMEFVYGPDVFGPKPEKRTLEAIRSSLQDPSCTGPEILYSIVMDVGRKQDAGSHSDYRTQSAVWCCDLCKGNPWKGTGAFPGAYSRNIPVLPVFNLRGV